MIAWLMIAGLVGGMTWFFCVGSIFLVQSLAAWNAKEGK